MGKLKIHISTFSKKKCRKDKQEWNCLPTMDRAERGEGDGATGKGVRFEDTWIYIEENNKG